MPQNARDDVICALVEFVKRATQKDATPAEYAALPMVAEVLLKDLSRN